MKKTNKKATYQFQPGGGTVIVVGAIVAILIGIGIGIGKALG